MYRITPNGANRVDIELEGKLETEQMRSMLDELVFASASIEHGRMLYRISNFHLPSLGAIGVELARLPSLFRLVRRFDRVAVLADRNWVKKVGEIEGALFPGLEVRGFDPDQRAEAEAWLEGVDVPAQPMP